MYMYMYMVCFCDISWLVWIISGFFPSTLSDVSEKELEYYIYISVWDWDRIGSNDYIGGMSMKVNDIITETCEGQRVDSWFKLLDDNSGKKRNERIISDEEAEKVRKKEAMIFARGQLY